ncbi:MAG: DUF3887 domain-containing protein [Armatimonadota bacterium]|nr:DUF3887 domain-containing protein [Armatimonadota bacterium]
MKKLVCAVLIIFSLSAQAVLAQQSASRAGALVPAANTIIDYLVKEDFSRVVRNFDSNMKATMPEDKLRQNWKALIEQAGAYKGQLGVHLEVADQDGQRFDVVVAKSEFQKSVVNIQIAFNTSKRVSGLYFLPVQQAPAVSQPTGEASQQNLSVLKPPPPDEKLVSLAGEFVGVLAKKEYSDAVTFTTDATNAETGAAKLKQKWERALSANGAFKKCGDARGGVASTGKSTAVLLACEFEKSTLMLNINFDESRQISGFDVMTKEAASEAELKSCAEAFVDLLLKDDFLTAAQSFDNQMKAALPAAKLAKAWQDIAEKGGAFNRRTGSRVEKVAPYDVVFVGCKFENGKIDIQVTFNSSLEVSGLFFRPVEAESTPKEAE